MPPRPVIRASSKSASTPERETGQVRSPYSCPTCAVRRPKQPLQSAFVLTLANAKIHPKRNSAYYRRSWPHSGQNRPCCNGGGDFGRTAFFFGCFFGFFVELIGRGICNTMKPVRCSRRSESQR